MQTETKVEHNHLTRLRLIYSIQRMRPKREALAIPQSQHGFSPKPSQWCTMNGHGGSSKLL